MRSTKFGESTWNQLQAGSVETPDGFDPATLEDLPEPAQRFLRRCLPADTPIAGTVELEMTGRIRLGSRWMAFTATQILRAGVGFVWRPIVGRGPVRFLGADELGPDGASMEFRLLGLIPVVRATGPDIAKSAAGRLAAETIAWLPQALTPQAGALWTPTDHTKATVSVLTPAGSVEVETTIADDGCLTEIALSRWNDSADPPAYESFGGSVDNEYTTEAGVRVAGSGTVGWKWDTADRDDGVFFNYTVTSARHR